VADARIGDAMTAFDRLADLAKRIVVVPKTE
jgi:hypothetical protein